MPTPQAPVIAGLIQANITTPIDPKVIPQYIQMISLNVATAWLTWNLGLQWLGLSVVGAGIGAWAGAGSGGAILQTSPLLVPYTPFLAATPYDMAFQQGFAQALQTTFASWALSYKFAGVPFVGSSGATPLTPGPFVANNIPVPLIAAGMGVAPLDAQIVALWSPIFMAAGAIVTGPTLALMQAFAKGVVQAFSQVYLATAQPTGALAVGVAAPPLGLGATSSLPGVIV